MQRGYVPTTYMFIVPPQGMKHTNYDTLTQLNQEHIILSLSNTNMCMSHDTPEAHFINWDVGSVCTTVEHFTAAQSTDAGLLGGS